MQSRIIVALDGMQLPDAFSLMKKLRGLVWGSKANDLLFGDTSAPVVVGSLREFGKVFADPKLHDIPNTVANSARKLGVAGANLISVHLSGGLEMVKAAVQACDDTGIDHEEGQILGITGLTSLKDKDFDDLFKRNANEAVLFLAGIGLEAGVRGIVSSPKEVRMIASTFPGLMRVTPGVRSPGVGVQDQARVDTPANAVKNGADLIVVGREITQAKDPRGAVAKINEAVALAA